MPGPELRIRLGDTLRVRFTNRLPQPTTIHWHGVRVPNAMDGVPHVTQPPVEPGGTFTYEFTPKDAGTFWFHPHVRSSEQVERGLYGVLIVEDPTPPPYARDVVWVLDDWLLDETRQIFDRFNTPARPDARRALGQLRHRQRPHRHGCSTRAAASGSACACSTPRTGASTRPNSRAWIRRSSRSTASTSRGRSRSGGSSWRPATAWTWTSRCRPAPQSRSLAVIDRFYAERPNHLADVVDRRRQPAPTAVVPVAGARARARAGRRGLQIPVTKEFRIDARRGGSYGIEWTFNGVAFAGHEHHGPPMLTLERGGWVRLRFVNDSFRLHPIHLHGMFFRLLARNDVPVDEPFFRDTVLMHSKETIDIGLVPLDAGKWMMHCHILEHAEAGMMTLFEVRG